jgi:4-hydroxy-3-polyprenylbenzoate decarboxylase
VTSTAGGQQREVPGAGSAGAAAPRRVVIGLSGASGVVYGVRLLEVLKATGRAETHLIVSKGAAATLDYEMERTVASVQALADHVHDEGNLASALASGTYPTDAMVVAPCSIRTLSAVATSDNATLMARAADVHLKERRRLVLLVRETPLHLGHLRLMTAVTEAGAIVLPPVPGFYARPRTVADVVDHTVTKVLDLIGFGDVNLGTRWTGPPA